MLAKTIVSGVFNRYLRRSCRVSQTSIEKVLVHPQHSSSSLVRLWADLRSKGFEIFGSEAMVAEFPEVKYLPDEQWSKPCFRKQVAFRGVENIDEAIGLINQHSSGHADAIVTESYGASQQFVQQVRSTSVYLNATARFQRCQFAEGDVVLGTTGRSGFGSIRMQHVMNVFPTRSGSIEKTRHSSFICESKLDPRCRLSYQIVKLIDRRVQCV